MARTWTRTFFENRGTDMDMNFFENRDMEIRVYQDLLGLECGRFKSLSLLSSD